MSVVKDLINRSARLIGVLATGEVLSSQELTDAFDVLNKMIEDWSNQKLFIPSSLRESFSMPTSKQSYSMGTDTTSGTPDFNTSRPQKVEQALIVIPGQPQAEINIPLLNQTQWASIIVKQIQSSVPQGCYVDYAYPNVNINLWPEPTANATLILYSWKMLASFVTPLDTFKMPAGYFRALAYNLALEIAPEFGMNPNELVIAQALESKATIKRLNFRPRYLSADAGLLRENDAFNWLTGE